MMTRIELSAEQRDALQAVLHQIADGAEIILTVDGVELAAMIPVEYLVDEPDKATAEEAPATLADLLQGHIGVLHSSEYVPGGAQLSEDSGRKFAAVLAAKQRQKSS